jgi:hypothetical protein
VFNRMCFAAITVLIFSGCAAPVPITELASTSTLIPVIIGDGPFKIQSLQPNGGSFAKLRVYIEGDGRAWITSSQPSTDPTPLSAMFINLAIADPGPAAYLARPCQFVLGANCQPPIWTERRFSREVIDAMSAALDALKRRFAVEQFELVGYSGGAAVALILAGERDDVFQVQSIAGNLDPVAWVRDKGLSPLSGSLDPLAYRAKLRTIPQRHFVASADQVIAPSLARGYASKLQAQCLQIVEVQGTHAAGFSDDWIASSHRPISCSAAD